MKQIKIECDNCGAKIPATGTVGLFTCEYCGHKIQLERATQSRPGTSPKQVAQVRRIVLAVVLVSVLLPLIGGMVIVGMVCSGARDMAKSVGVGGDKVVIITGGSNVTFGGNKIVVKTGNTSINVGNMFWKGPRLIWDHAGGALTPIKIGGVEHIVGRVRSLGSGQDQLTIRMIASSTLKDRFSTPDLGSYAQASRAVRFAVVGERLLVSDGRNRLNVYDFTRGKPLKALELTDRVEQLCPMTDGRKVWVQVVDKRNLVFDVKDHSSQESATRPGHCPRSFYDRYSLPGRPEGVPAVEGFAAKRLFDDPEFPVVLGAKSPGTPLPQAVGFEPGSKRVRWHKLVATVDPTTVRTGMSRWYGGLAGGRFVTVYGVGTKGWRVVALDARGGDQLWDKQLKKIFAVDSINGMTVTDGFVYVERTGSLDVLRASDGKLVGSIGSEVYEG